MAIELPLPISLLLLTIPESFIVKFIATDFQRMLITSSIPVLFGLNVLAWIFYTVFIYPFFVSPLRHLPEPTSGYPHYARYLVLSSRFPSDEYLRWMKEVPNDGLIRFRGLFNSETLLPTDTKAHADIMVHRTYDFAKPEKLRAFLRRFIGDGLINIEGDDHKFQRKVVSPSFSYRHIQELYPVFWSKSLALTQYIGAEIDNGSENVGEAEKTGIVEINHWSTKVTLDIIGLAGLGFEFNALKNHDDPLVSLYEEVLEPTTEKKFLCLLYLYLPEKLVKALPWQANHRLNLNTDRLRDVSRRLLAEKAEKLKKEGNGEQNDILSGLLGANVFSHEMLVDQLLTFLAAGHESTSTTFTWGCYLLAINPSAQTRLREEVRTHLSSWLNADQVSPKNLPPDLAETLETLPYLNAVCNEISRLYPAVPIVTRTAVRPTTIAGHAIPPGTIIAVSPWAVNRSPAHWGPDAEAFKPERWIDADGRANNVGGALNNYAQLTFFQGPRSCIGQRFSMAELRALVASFVARFEWELGMPEEEVIPAGFVTVKPKNGLKLRIKRV